MLYYGIICEDDLIKFPHVWDIKMYAACTLSAEMIDSGTPESYNKKYLPGNVTGYVSSTKYTKLQYNKGQMGFVASLLIQIETWIIKKRIECFASKHV